MRLQNPSSVRPPFRASRFSPVTRTIDVTSSDPSVEEGKADLLIERLESLVISLTKGDLDSKDIEHLQVGMDMMENLIQDSIEGKHYGDISASEVSWDEVKHSEGNGEAYSIGEHSMVSSIAEEKLPKAYKNMEIRKPQTGMSTDKAILLVEEAQALESQIAKALSELRARKEESSVITCFQSFHMPPPTNACQHIHDLLITKTEKAAQRIVFLENQVSELYVRCSH